MSSDGKAIKGGAYTSKLYFDPRADLPKDEGFLITQQELLEKLKTLIDVTEEIFRVRYYSNPLSSWQLTNALFYHAFLVFKTENWYWSIEKNTQGLTIQRSKDMKTVVNYYRRAKRTTGMTSNTDIQLVDEILQGQGGSMRGLLYSIWKKEFLLEKYHLLKSNCQIFADSLFEIMKKLRKDVYFDPDADSPPRTDKDYFVTADEFLTEVNELGNKDRETEHLTKVAIYSAPYDTHKYVLLVTNKGFSWSAEKRFGYYDQLIIQRAKKEKILHDECKRKERDPANPKITPNVSHCIKKTDVDKTWTLNRVMKMMLHVSQMNKENATVRSEFATEMYRKCESKPSTSDFY